MSLALVTDRDRILTVAAPARDAVEGFIALAGTEPASAAYRDAVRGDLIALASSGESVVPLTRTFSLSDAVDAFGFVSRGHTDGQGGADSLNR